MLFLFLSLLFLLKLSSLRFQLIILQQECPLLGQESSVNQEESGQCPKGCDCALKVAAERRQIAEGKFPTLVPDGAQAGDHKEKATNDETPGHAGHPPPIGMN